MEKFIKKLDEFKKDPRRWINEMDRLKEENEKLDVITKELEDLIPIEEGKRDYHKRISKDTKSEYFYHGRVAYMKHLLNLIKNN